MIENMYIYLHVFDVIIIFFFLVNALHYSWRSMNEISARMYNDNIISLVHIYIYMLYFLNFLYKKKRRGE